MSGLTVSLKLYNEQQKQSVAPPTTTNDSDDMSSSSLSSLSSSSSSPSSSGPVSPSSSYAVLPSIASSSPALPTLTCSPSSSNIRPNEHLAVLLPNDLWKPDSLAVLCDNFYCRCRFSIFERRHHCRKCGGVFCHSCSSRSLPLLDTTNLPFSHPPRNNPISQYESPDSPIVHSRVCDDCWDQIHGCPSSPRTPDLVRSGSVSPVSLSEISTSVTTVSPSLSRRRLRLMPSISSLTSQSSTHSTPSASQRPNGSRPPSRRISLRSSTQPPLPADVLQEIALATSPSSTTAATDPHPSYGELESYPLKRHSAVCKITGGGRWTPEPTPPPSNINHLGYIGCKQLPFTQEKASRPGFKEVIIEDGMFRYRAVQHQEGGVIFEEVDIDDSIRPVPLSTF